uniref:Uncharacterized protein n=1 Tax=Solanum lycopersicum TaxID=4081 RepID=A0A3Q7ECX8_SOLLC
MERIDFVENKIPSSLFWIQTMTILDVLYRFTYYFEYFKNYDSTNWAIKFMKRKIEMLYIEENPKVLVNNLII